VVRGGYEWVDVRDVAQGHVLAAERGQSGESYLLSAGRMTMGEIARVVCRAAGVKAPLLELPLGFVQLLAAASPAWEWVSRERALLTPYALHQLAVTFDVDTRKARAELGFTTRPLEVSFTDAWRWLSADPHSPLQRELTRGPARALRRPLGLRGVRTSGG
jgi:dihydroflavonol-4-reductase